MDFSKLETMQPTVARMIQNAFLTHRVAHAYIFDGPAGTGKREAALLMAKRYFCQNPQGALHCSNCSACSRIESGNYPDIHRVVPDGKNIKVEQIRNLQKEFGYRGVESNRKCYIIEQAEKMNPQAANSLLKFLEEPEGETLAILITESSNRLLPTIQSRSQVLSFIDIAGDQLTEKLKLEGIGESLAKSVSKVAGSYEQATSLLENDWFLHAQEKILKVLDSEDILMAAYVEWIPFFKEAGHQKICLLTLLSIYREILDIKLYGYKPESKEIGSLSEKLTIAEVNENLKSILVSIKKIQSNGNFQMVVEQLSIKMTKHYVE